MIAKRLLMPLLLAAAVSCGRQAQEATVPQEMPAPEEAPEAATTSVADSAPKVLVSKGVIRSANEVEVFSRIEGQLLDVRLLEGTVVHKGQVLFRLDDWDLKGKVAVSRTALEQAQLRMEEILVGQGYKRDNLETAPEKTREYAKVKSGVNVCATELEINQEKLSRAVIKAPMSGVITGVKALSYSFVEPGETLCTIVDPKNLIVEFSILETELRKFSLGSTVEVRSIAYSEIPHTATIRSIGSVVDEYGMIRIEATLSDPDKLLPGMTAIVNL